jgi:phosphatidylinositol glycan class B
MNSLSNKYWLIAAFIVYAISAIFNNSFYHYDEHYQLIEFAELKAGNTIPKDLAWEYGMKIRSAVQPLIAFALIGFMRWLNLTSPYLIMILLRLMTAVLALITLNYFIKKTEHLLNNELKKWYRPVAFFLWFIPFINVRFSSECYSGFVFILAIGLTYSHKRFKYFFIGFLLGLSFLFRFQTAFMSVGFFSWLIYKRYDFKHLLQTMIGAVLMLGIGYCVDYWFYGTPTLSPLNYYVSNVIKNVASSFGVSPWYYYFTGSIKTMLIPIGILVWGLSITYFYLNPKSIFTWIIIPFLIAHILTPHKELRFLFPVVNLIPLIFLLAIQDIKYPFSLHKRIIELVHSSWVLLIVINAIALITVMFAPADDEGRTNVTQKIYQLYQVKPAVLWTINNEDPYQPIGVRESFYLNKNVTSRPLTTFNQIKTEHTNSTELVIIRNEYLPYCDSLFMLYKMTKLAVSIPPLISDIKAFAGYGNRPYILYEVRPK